MQSSAAAIVGVHEHGTRLAPHHSAIDLLAEAAADAVVDAGLLPSDIDGLAVTGYPMDAVYVAEHLGLHPSWIDTTAIGGSSYLSHIAHAADAIAQGRAQVVLVAYGSVARSRQAGFGTSVRATPTSPMSVDDVDALDIAHRVTLASQYALVANRHMHEYGTTPEQLAAVAVSTRAHAASNPRARFSEPITIDDVLNSRLVASPLHLLDCCVITDGAGAVIVASPEIARSCAHPPIWIVGAAEAIAHDDGGRRRILDTAASRSGPEALARAGVTHADIDLCMIYDSFTISVVTALEGLGFCAPGEGGPFVEAGTIGPGGALPINPDGGALSNHHPGRRGLFLAIEATQQLRQDAGQRQVAAARTALCHGIGGYLASRHSGVTLILAA